MTILRDMVDVMIFCDVDSKAEKHIVKSQADSEGFPEALFECGDAWEVLMRLERINVLFYRRDSSGEGGSGVAVNSRKYLSQFVRRLPPQGGYLVTDGSNERNNVFRTMNRSLGLLLDGWRLKAEALAAPSRGGLRWIRISRDPPPSADSVPKARA